MTLMNSIFVKSHLHIRKQSDPTIRLSQSIHDEHGGKLQKKGSGSSS